MTLGPDSQAVPEGSETSPLEASPPGAAYFVRRCYSDAFDWRTGNHTCLFGSGGAAGTAGANDHLPRRAAEGLATLRSRKPDHAPGTGVAHADPLVQFSLALHCRPPDSQFAAQRVPAQAASTG